MAELMGLAINKKKEQERAKQEAAAAAKAKEEENRPNLTCDSLIYPLNWAYGIWVLCTVFGYAYLYFAPPELKQQFDDSGALQSLKFAYVLQFSWFVISFRERLQMSAIVLVFISRQLYTSLVTMNEMNIPVADTADLLAAGVNSANIPLAEILAGTSIGEYDYIHPGLLMTVVAIHYAWAVVTTLQAFNVYVVRSRFDWRVGLFSSFTSLWLAIGYSIYNIWIHGEYVFSLVTSWMLFAIYWKVRANARAAAEAHINASSSDSGNTPNPNIHHSASATYFANDTTAANTTTINDGDRRGWIYYYGPELAKVYRMSLEMANVRVPLKLNKMTNVVTTKPLTIEQALQQLIENSVLYVCLYGSLGLVVINVYYLLRTQYMDLLPVQLPLLDLPEWLNFSSSWICFAVACLLSLQAALTHSYTVYNAGYQMYIVQVIATKEKAD